MSSNHANAGEILLRAMEARRRLLGENSEKRGRMNQNAREIEAINNALRILSAFADDPAAFLRECGLE